MFKPILMPRDIGERYHRFLPEEMRSYLKGRGIPATLIDRQLLGWNGERITIPIFGGAGEVLGFRYAKSPEDRSESPEILSDPALGSELYGWETLAREPHRVVICEGEFDRLVLEARGFPAVASTGVAGVFVAEWAAHFKRVEHVFICFHRSVASDAAAKKVQALVPKARVAKLPAEVGERGSISDYFVGLGRTPLDFEIVLAGAVAAEDESAELPPTIRKFRPVHRSLQRRAERVRKVVPLYKVAGQFTHLEAAPGRLVGHCPLHDDGSLSFSVYPESGTYACSGCGAEGEIVMFLMDKESMTFGQALEALERFAITDELYGTSS